MIELNNLKDNRLENINERLQEVLRAREERVINQKRLIKKYNLPLLSITLNIPGPEKDNAKIRKIYHECLKAVKKELSKKENTKIIYQKEYFSADGPESFLIVEGLPVKELKKTAVKIEDNHPLGRLFDIDVLNERCYKISRQDIGISLRKCIICNDLAINCITSRKHKRKEIIEKVNKMIDDFSAQSFDYWVDKIGGITLKSILLELSCTPKPGLVDRFNNGANQDMDFTTFISSTAAIAYGMYQFVRLGIDYTDEIEEILPHLRKIGIGMERNMFEATGGINTQKGLIFLGGLICAAAGSLIKEGKKLSPEHICQKIKKICKGIVDKELKILRSSSLEKKLTNGERLFLKYGISGIRGEAERGFPTVREKGLPTLRAGLKDGLSFNDASVQSLISIMSSAEDTNVILRSNLDFLHREVQAKAKEIIELGGMYNLKGRRKINTLDRYLIKKGVNPGGSADLLAITITLYYFSLLPVPEILK